jgi:hypothetical protein
MTRTAVVTQPTYLPWLGYFQAIASADVVVFLDTVQFERRSWQSRNRLKGSNGEPYWLTVPVAKHSQDTPILEIQIADTDDWAAKHLRSIGLSLQGAPHGDAALESVAPHYATPPAGLSDLNISLIGATLSSLDIVREIHRASELGVVGRRTDLLLAICKDVGADRYLSAAGAAAYLEDERGDFDDAEIEVVYQTWEHPVYPQAGPGFVSHLAAIDAIANLGGAGTRDLLEPKA